MTHRVSGCCVDVSIRVDVSKLHDKMSTSPKRSVYESTMRSKMDPIRD